MRPCRLVASALLAAIGPFGAPTAFEKRIAYAISLRTGAQIGDFLGRRSPPVGAILYNKQTGGSTAIPGRVNKNAYRAALRFETRDTAFAEAGIHSLTPVNSSLFIPSRTEPDQDTGPLSLAIVLPCPWSQRNEEM